MTGSAPDYLTSKLVNHLTSVGEKLETHKAFLVGHVINQGRKIYSGRHACLTKENVTEMLRASRRHHLCL